MSDFPANIIEALGPRLAQCAGVAALDNGGKAVFRRPLRPMDPNGSIGVFGATWEPVQDSHEMLGIPNFGPTLGRYTLVIQSLVKHGSSEEGELAHAALAKQVRSMLYRDSDLRLTLGTLQVVSTSGTERAQQWGVGSQRFVNNEVNGIFLFLATTEFWLQTEST